MSPREQALGLRRSARLDQDARKTRRAAPHPRRGFAGTRNHRDHRPREQDRSAGKTEIRDQRSGIKDRENRQSGKYAPGGPALLFENVKGHPGHKVLINQFGSERRMAMALGVDRLDEIADRIHGLMNVKAPEGLFDKLKMLPQLGALTSAFPKTVRRRKTRRAKRSCGARISTSTIFPSSSAGRTTAGVSSLCPACTRAIPTEGYRQAQYRHVSHAGLRRPNHRHALAAAKGGRRALPRGAAEAPRPSGRMTRPRAKRRARSDDGGVRRRRNQHSRRRRRRRPAANLAWAI